MPTSFERLRDEVIEGLDDPVGLRVREAERCAHGGHNRCARYRRKEIGDEIGLLNGNTLCGFVC